MKFNDGPGASNDDIRDTYKMDKNIFTNDLNINDIINLLNGSFNSLNEKQLNYITTNPFFNEDFIPETDEDELKEDKEDEKEQKVNDKDKNINDKDDIKENEENEKEQNEINKKMTFRKDFSFGIDLESISHLRNGIDIISDWNRYYNDKNLSKKEIDQNCKKYLDELKIYLDLRDKEFQILLKWNSNPSKSNEILLLLKEKNIIRKIKAHMQNVNEFCKERKVKDFYILPEEYEPHDFNSESYKEQQQE